MKKIVFIVLILSNRGLLFAQDCIPNPVICSRDIVERLQYNTKDSFANSVVTWNDIEPIYDSILVSDNKLDSTSSKERAKAKKDIEVKMVGKLYKDIDSILARGQRFGIRWNKIIFKNDASRITKEKALPAALWFNDGKLQFSCGDSVYEISYQALLFNGRWELAGISPYIDGYDKNNNALGEIGFSYDENKTDSTPGAYNKTIDSAKAIMESKSVIKKRKTPVKKKTTIANKQAIKKPDTN